MKKSNIIWWGLGAAIIVGGFFSPFASSFPDGLERVGENLGFSQWIQDSILSAPIADYTVQGIQQEAIATGAAGMIGVFLTFILVYIIGKLVIKKNKITEV